MDYSEPLLELKALEKAYSDAMRLRRCGYAQDIAVKIVRIGVDLIDAAEDAQIALPRFEQLQREREYD